MGMPYFSKLKTIVNEISFVNNNFKPATIKNDNGAVVMRKILVQRKRNQQLHQKNRHKGIEDLLICAPMYFLNLTKLKTFRVTQNETPKMEKNVRFYK